MCIAIYKPYNKVVSNNIIKRCWTNNPDGGGFMFARDGNIHIYKELESVKKFIKSFRRVEKDNPTCNFVLHFRIATSGYIDKKNCHPFMINSELAFCHNGILSIDTPNKNLSDTLTFRNRLLRKLGRNWIHDTATCDLMGMAIKGSKMVFMTNTGDVKIINEHNGVWDAGVWYSNHTYKSTHVSAMSKAWDGVYSDYDYVGYAGKYGVSHQYEDEFCIYCGEALEFNSRTGVCSECYKAIGKAEYWAREDEDDGDLPVKYNK